MAHSPISFLDGGLGTTLRDQYHVEIDGTNKPLWSSDLLISDPATLLSAQTAFAEAGADIILTDTYQASYEGFTRTKISENENGISESQAKNYMRDAVNIARAAGKNVKRNHQVALSLGAYGAVMIPSQEYSGKYDEMHATSKQLQEWHSKRLECFTSSQETWANVDIVAFETIPLLTEIEAARRVMWEAMYSRPGIQEKPFWISCVIPGDDLCLPDGSSIGQVINTMLCQRDGWATPFAVGINCTKLLKIPDLLIAFEKAVGSMVDSNELESWPALVLYPDGTKGEVYNTTTHEWESKEDADSNSMAPWDQTLYEVVTTTQRKGLWKSILVGGCCKTTPEAIKKLRTRFEGSDLGI